MATAAEKHIGADSATRHRDSAGSKIFRGLLWFQGLYYFSTGIWPLISIESFQKVTGRKTDHLTTGRESDHWLVMTVGVLIVAIAITLLVAAWRKSPPLEAAVLALGSALGLTMIDIVYVARGAIARIYLLDAAIEVPLIAAWILVLCTHLQKSHTSPTGS
jgi:hypothetical protein